MIDARQTMTENGLKQAIKAVARANGWLWHDDGQERVVHKSGNAGYPDLTLARDGVVLWIECKAIGGKVSTEQWQWISALQPYCHVITPEQWWAGRVHELLG